jgi:hypothetical protein
MKLTCFRFPAFAIAAAFFINSAYADPFAAIFDTACISPGVGNYDYTWILVYDSVGLPVTTIFADGYGVDDGQGGSYWNLNAYGDLPPGKYSFMLEEGWTGLVNVTSGAALQFPREAFPNSEAPVDPPFQTVYGNFLVEGSIEMQGRLFNLGTNPFNSDEPAFSLRIDYGNPLFQRNIAATSDATWTWEVSSGEEMRLASSNGNSTLYVNSAQVLTTANSGSLYLPIQPTKLAVGSSVSAGTNALAAGNNVQATGPYSAAFGLGTKAQYTAEFVVGRYNNSTDPDASNWSFVVGNGNSSVDTSNAFVIRNNGDANLKGKLSVGLGGLNVSFGGVPSLLVGADENLATRTNNVNKIMAMAMPHYSSGTQAPMALLGGNSGVSWNNAFIGGGLNGTNAATGIYFFTAPNATTPVGLQRMSINHHGAVGIGAHAFGGTFHEAFGGLDVSYGGIPGTLVLGAEMNTNTRTNETSKFATIVIPHYSSSQRPLLALAANSHSWANEIMLGNGSGAWNCATDISFHTGETITSNFGKPRLVINRTGGVAAGEGAVAIQPSQIVVGKFNDTRNSDNGTDHTQGIFVVGNGTSTAQADRKNAMRVVEQNGQSLVLIQKAGDISMGEFEAGPRP